MDGTNDRSIPPRVDAIHLRYRLSWRDISRVNIAEVVRSPASWVLAAVLVVFFLVLFMNSPRDPSPFVGLIVFLLLIFVGVPACLALAVTRQIEPQELFIDDSGAILRAARAESRLEWQFFTTARELGSLYVLKNGRQALVIPKRAFEVPGTEEVFRALCAQHSKTHFAQRLA